KGVKGWRIETLLIDVSESTHYAAVSRTQQMKIIRMFAIFRQHGNGIEGGSIMMKLAFDSTVLTCIKKVPIPACATVVPPMRNSRHVSDDGVNRHFCLIGIPEVLAPGVNLFLARGIPWHLTAKGISFALPMIRPRLHHGLKLVRIS